MGKGAFLKRDMARAIAPQCHIAFLGFGEVGQRFARDLANQGAVRLTAYDIAIDDPGKRQALHDAASTRTVRLDYNAQSACAGADIIISAVTASEAVNVARDVARFIAPGQIFFDLNSAAPSTKRAAMAALGAEAYVEGAVMAPVLAPGITVPILAGGVTAEGVAERLNALGFAIKAVSSEIGIASAMKLCRSIVIKGLEVLMMDCARASKAAGVSEAVFASLDASYPSINWAALAANMTERVETHGIRRAAEMAEAAEMVADLGFDPALIRSISDAQARGAKIKP